MKARKALLLGIGLLVAGTVSAATNFYLHADMVANDTPNDKTLWWTDPVGGVTQESLGATTMGNRFDVNGYLFRSQNSGGPATFNGTAVVGSNGSKQDVGFLLYTGTWNAHALEITDGKNLLVRPHQSFTGMALQDLMIGADADLTFRTLAAGNCNNVSLSTTNIAGSGVIEFGISGYANDVNANWNFSVFDTTPEFSGGIQLIRGQLTFGSAFALDEATFSVNALDDNSVVLSNNVSFGKVVCGSTLATGTYTASELNAELSTDRFSGPGTLTAVGLPVKTYYLHADMPAGTPVLDKGSWFDDPSGGTDMATLGGVFSGNRFDVNGFEWRAPNVPSSEFSGTIVVGDAGAGICLQYAGDWQLSGGMDINGYALIRPHRSAVSMTVSDLLLGSSGELAFRTLTGNNVWNLSVANISGSGTITFGIDYDNDVNGQWNLSVSDTSPEFTGSVDLFRGQLTFGSAFALNEATFTIASAENNGVVLSNHVSFLNVTYGATSLPNGIYTAAELNAELGTDRFSGPATLIVGGIPPSQRYTAWTDTYPSLGASTNYVDDPDSDDMDNLLEYALGGNPTSPDAASIQPSSNQDASWMYYIYSRRLDATDRGLEYSVVSGTDLVYGGLTNTTEEVGAAMIDLEFETVTNRMSVGTESKAFMKLSVEITD